MTKIIPADKSWNLIATSSTSNSSKRNTTAIYPGFCTEICLIEECNGA